MTAVTESAEIALRGPRHRIDDAVDRVPDAAGLYAIHADRASLDLLGLTAHDPDDAVYVGKAETSLVSRDVRTHFATGKTGSSTVRRSFAALLRGHLGLVAVPRNRDYPDGSASYALGVDDDRRLTRWMTDRLTLAVWVKPDGVRLRDVERAVLTAWQPPLNLTDVGTPWQELKKARAVMAAESRAWSPSPAHCVRPEPDLD